MQTTIKRLLPTGATLSSGALTCVSAVAGLSVIIISNPNQHKYETTVQSLDAPQRALHALGDAALADSRDAPHPQHAPEVPHHGTPEPLPALSRTPAPALRPAHTGDVGLPLPPAQPPRWRRRYLTAHEWRGRRHHDPPPPLAFLLHQFRTDSPAALRVAARLCGLRPADTRAPRHYLVGTHLLPCELPPQPTSET